MIKLLKNFIKNFNIKNKSTLLSISGGIDSIVMAEIFNEAKLKFSIAHCNFGLRGIESKKDEIFVEKIAKKYKVKFYKKKFDTIKHSKQNNISIQMSARNLRYDWLNYISKKNGFSKIATAHHINDSIETFIINIIKGSGISGFHGILYKNKKIIRPIICLNKKMIIEYAKKKKLKWREDLSNKKNKYQRNIVRNKVIPILKNINPSFEKNIKNTIEKISQTEKIFYKYIKKIKNEVFYFKKSNYYINIEKVKKEHYEYIYILILEIIKKFQFNYSQIKKIIKIEKNGKIIESKKWKVLIDKKLWVLNKNKNKNKNKIILNYNIRNINNIKINIKKK